MKRKRRWIFRLLLTMAIIVVVFIVGVQVVLSTGIPRRLVISTVEKEMGLRVTAESLSTGWFGETTLQNVTLSLPLATQAFLQVRELKASHSWLPTLLVTRSLTIQSIELNHPKLVVVQDAAGQWNLQEVAELLGKLGGAKSAADQQQAQKNSIPVLPAVTITDATVQVTDNHARTATIEPLSLTGRPDGAVAWRYNADVPAHLHLTGQLAPGSDWKHMVQFQIDEVGEWARPWVAKWPEAARVSGSWKGQLQDGHVAGRLVIEQLQVADVSGSGAVEVRGEGSGTAIYPKAFQLKTGGTHFPPVNIADGSVLLDGTSATVRKIRMSTAGGQVQVDGRFGWADGAIALTAAWENITLPKGVAQSGDLTLDVTQPWPGQPKVQGTLHSRGIAGPNSWDVAMDLKGQGTAWNSIDWQLHGERLQLRGRKTIAISNLTAALTTRGTLVSLQQVSVEGNRHIAGRGTIDVAKRFWWVSLDGRGWPSPGSPGLTMDLDLDAWGTPQIIRLKQFYARSGELAVTAQGDYIFDKPEPVDAKVTFTQVPTPTKSDDGDLLRGELYGDAHLLGTLLPRHLHFTGHAYGSDLVVDRRPLGNLAVDIHGDMNGEAAAIYSDKLDLMGGNWDLVGWWPSDDRAFRLSVAARNVNLSQAANDQRVSGNLQGQWDFEMTAPTVAGVSMNGTMALDAVKIRKDKSEASTEIFSADKIAIGEVKLNAGDVQLNKIQLTQPDGGIDASVSLNLSDPSQIAVTMQTQSAGWLEKIPSMPVGVRFWGGTDKIEIDAKHQAVRGDIQARLAVAWHDAAMATIQAKLHLAGRTMVLSGLDVAAVTGHATGGATVDFDHPYESTAQLDWYGIESSELVTLVPALDGLTGQFTATLRVHPTVGPKPLEPLEVNLDIGPTNASFRGAQIGTSNMTVFAGPERFVMDNRPEHQSKFNVAGGTIYFWARATRHDGDILQAQADVSFENLDLKQISHAAKPDSAPEDGKLRGRLSIVGNPSRWRDSFGDGEVEVANSDLVEVAAIRDLYGFMHLGQNMRGSTGRGTVVLRLEQSQLNILRAHYFNKGTEILASGSIAEIWKGKEAPVDITAVGSARPLSQIKLPFFKDVDAILSVLQSSLVSAKVEGTLGNARVAVIPFSSIGDGMRRFLLGDVKSETGGSAK